ncbi:65-kDa microtubule-associated protein 3-like isoform X2 [Salvia splendens]|uniref:65-kDa microtubule-associated protein 3-like isoform X2 n=1 Tax=Salvia splendens TaxID=180675 RepID=UPI001C26013A|nr:65-kDa microtubule-associated protein 3-like isoform X2 [Salvia splendens]
METTCGSLLLELQKMWDEVGEADNDRDIMLFELEQECLDAYRRKVDHANRSRAQLRQTVADAEAQLADISAALGDRPTHIKKSSGSLKQELETIMPQLEDMREKRNERKSQFSEVLKQINSISMELAGSAETSLVEISVDESDLSIKKLDDLRTQLLLLQKEKDERRELLLHLLSITNALCLVLGMDFKSTICSVHPSLDNTCERKSISADTIQGLSTVISRLKDVKLQRMQRLQDLAMTMVELWTLMDTPVEEQQMFQNVTLTIAAAENELTEPNSLSLEIIYDAEAEVLRLQEMKTSKIKEVLLKKRLILEEICLRSHMIVEGQYIKDLSIESIESGAISASYLLEELEAQISKVKEEAFSRKEILEKVQKWLLACEEECWLEEYNRDDNRYNAGRGAHLMLKRAEKARVLVNKIPGMVDTLKSKLKAWEKERNTEFLYDGVGLISMIDQYTEIKLLKEQERQIQKKKLQGQLMAEQEAIYGSKPSPSKSGAKCLRPSTGGAASKRFSLGGSTLQTALDKATPSSRSIHKKNPVKRQTLNNSHHHTGLAALSSGKKNTHNGTVKQHSSQSSISHHSGSARLRKALSPLSSLCSNVILQQEEQNTKNSVLQDAEIGCYKTPAAAMPTKRYYSANDENRTPKTMPIPVPATPPTASSAMRTAKTPFTPGVGVRATEQVEYSFEERRAGFAVARTLSMVDV